MTYMTADSDDFFVHTGNHLISQDDLIRYSNGNVATSDNFAELVERRVIENETSYIEETSALMEELDIEPEDGIHLISKPLMEKIRVEAIKTNRLKEKFNTTTIFFEDVE